MSKEFPCESPTRQSGRRCSKRTLLGVMSASGENRRDVPRNWNGLLEGLVACRWTCISQGERHEAWCEQQGGDRHASPQLAVVGVFVLRGGSALPLCAGWCSRGVVCDVQKRDGTKTIILRAFGERRFVPGTQIGPGGLRCRPHLG